jgi:hypothetical protein
MLSPEVALADPAPTSKTPVVEAAEPPPVSVPVAVAVAVAVIVALALALAETIVSASSRSPPQAGASKGSRKGAMRLEAGRKAAGMGGAPAKEKRADAAYPALHISSVDGSRL